MDKVEVEVGENCGVLFIVYYKMDSMNSTTLSLWVNFDYVFHKRQGLCSIVVDIIFKL